MRALVLILAAILMSACSTPPDPRGLDGFLGFAFYTTVLTVYGIGAGVDALMTDEESYDYPFECAHCGKTIDEIRYDVERKCFSKSKDACVIVRTHTVDSTHETLQSKHVAKKASEEWGRTQVEKYAKDHFPKNAWEERGEWYCSLTCANAAWRAQRTKFSRSRSTRVR